MDYKKLKKGDVIAFKDYDDGERIVIFDRVEKNVFGELHLYTYAEFIDDCLFLEKEEPGYFYILGKDITDYRFVTDEEKNKLYNAICKYYIEEYDKSWFNYFTDSSYVEIQDFLLDVFCINVEEYDNGLLYPDFVNGIIDYIWNQLCILIGETNDKINILSDVVMVNKSEFITKLKRWLELETDWNMEYVEGGRNPNFGKIDELIKYMEE